MLHVNKSGQSLREIEKSIFDLAKKQNKQTVK